MLNTAYIGLGSNLDNPAQQILIAVEKIDSLPETTLVSTANFYRSAPVGPKDQPDFINTAVKIETGLTPEELLQALQQIETNQGRVKVRHWGERNIDLDILLYNASEQCSPTLTIPHAELLNRDFVIRPLLDITPNLALPSGVTLQSALAKCHDNQLKNLGKQIK